MTADYDPEHNEQKALQRIVDWKGKHVLEIGCGDGRLTWKYARAAAHVVGIDVDRDELKVARADRPHDLRDKILLAEASARWLPFPGEKFDMAVLAWSL